MKKTIYTAIMGIAMALASCADMDVMPQGSELTEEQLKDILAQNPERAEAELNGLYSLMLSPGTVMGQAAYQGQCYPDDGGYALFCLMTDLNAADMTTPSTQYNWFRVASALTDRDPSVRQASLRWRLFYQQIKAANDLISKIDTSTTSRHLRQTAGQAYAVRAFDYLNLAPYYQFGYAVAKDKPCVPIITEKTDTKQLGRRTVAEVYEQIIADLCAAEHLLSDYERTDKTHVNISVVYGLKARAYLAMEQWQEALSYATLALSACDGTLCDGLPYSQDEVSRPAFCNIDDHNWMWGLHMTDEMINAADASWPSWLSSFSINGYSTGKGQYMCINPLLYAKISETDVRRGWWVDQDLHSDNLAYVTWKSNKHTLTGDDIATADLIDVKLRYEPYTNVKFGFNDGANLTLKGGDWCMMRVEEMMLIEIECAAQLGQTDIASTKLEYLAGTCRDTDYQPTHADILSEVQLQRRIELWGEGFAFADMMRWQQPLVRFHNSDAATADANLFNIEAGDPYLLMRFPDSELNANPMLEQNTGGSSPTLYQNSTLRDGITD